MRTIYLLIACYFLNINLFAQVKELEKFRKEITLFVHYDTGKNDSIPKTEANTATFKASVEKAFLQFVAHKESKDLEGLKKKAQNQGSEYWFDKYMYSFHKRKRDFMVKSEENNINYHISFYGLYDYKLSNFVSIYIQPFVINKKDYAAYYYKLNGTGRYYIKDVASNKIVFSAEAFTSNAPIDILSKIDESHLLLVEDMGDNGQRAFVVQTNQKTWKPIQAFKGNAFVQSNKNYTDKVFSDKRTYLRLASTRTIQTHQGMGLLRTYGIKFDEANKSISYRNGKGDSDEITARWENGLFTIDDYYLGQHLPDQSMPYPD